MHVKFLKDWRGYRANSVRDIPAGEGEILLIRKVAQPAGAPDGAAENPKRSTRKRVKRARKNRPADSVGPAPG